jgi:hypothetical protein
MDCTAGEKIWERKTATKAWSPLHAPPKESVPCGSGPGVTRVRARVAVEALVDLVVAIVVDLVVDLFGIGVDGGVGVVAVVFDAEAVVVIVGARAASIAGVAEARVAGVTLAGGILVDGAVAVGVHTVAVVVDGHARVGTRIEVVAVGVDLAETSGCRVAGQAQGRTRSEAVTVVVLVPDHGCVVVGDAVAVLIHLITGLDRIGVDGVVEIVAVGVVRHVAGAGGIAGLVAAVGVVAVAVTVGVREVGRHDPLVGATVAVVVLAVAALAGGGVDVRAGVVAVRGIGDVARGLLAGRGGAGSIAVAVEVIIRIPGARVGSVVVVHRAITVVVHAVADLGGRGAHRVVGVVTVGVVQDVVGGLLAGHLVVRGIAVAVAVGIVVPGAGIGAGAGIRGPVAVVVDVVAHLGGGGVDRSLPIVTVRCVGDIARGLVALDIGGAGVAVAVTVAIGVPGRGVRGRVLVDGAVAVVVHAVADLGGVGVHRSVEVVAVRGVRNVGAAGAAGRVARVAVVTESIGVGVGVPGAGIERVVVIHRPVAVVVHAVADLVGVGIDGGVGVVAVVVVAEVPGGLGTGAGLLEGVAVTVAVEIIVGVVGDQQILVGGTVAVVVLAVADFLGAGVVVGVGVVAVRSVRDRPRGLVAERVRSAGVTETVRVPVVVPGAVATGVDARVIVIGRSTAVLVDVAVVADFDLAGVDGPFGVVAVGVVRDVARERVTGLDRGPRGVAEAVAVQVRVERVRVRGVLVDAAVTVVVHAVADLAGAGVDGPVGVVAVGVVADEARGGLTGGGRAASVTVAVAVAVGVEGLGVGCVVLVGGTVAVVVDPVTDLVRFRVDRVVGVIAVRSVVDVAGGLVAGDGAVRSVTVVITIDIRVPGGRIRGRSLVAVTVAVVVDAVADLGLAGVGRSLPVVAVAAVGDVARGLVALHQAHAGVAEQVGVAVVVPGTGIDGGVFVHITVAVVIDVVADLAGVGVDVGLGVVAVGAVAHVTRGGLAGNGRATGVTEAVGVAVGVEGLGVGCVVLVGGTVAVVVDPIAHLGGVRVDGRVGVVAVGTGIASEAKGLVTGEVDNIGVTVEVGVGVGVPGSLAADVVVLVVDVTVAVVVDVVADLGGVRVDAGVVIVAVGVVGDHGQVGVGITPVLVDRLGITEAVGVTIDVPLAVVVVDLAIAVVVDAVAVLDGTRVGGRDGVIAVGGVGDVVGRGLTRHQHAAGVTVAVTVEIRVPVGTQPDGGVGVVAVVVGGNAVVVRVDQQLVRSAGVGHFVGGVGHLDGIVGATIAAHEGQDDDKCGKPHGSLQGLAVWPCWFGLFLSRSRDCSRPWNGTRVAKIMAWFQR